MRLSAQVPLPSDWRRVPARFLFSRQQRPPRETDEIVTAFRDGTVTLRRNRRVEGFTNAVQEIGYQSIRRGDLVIHSMDGFAGAIGVSDSDGKASPVVHAYVAQAGVEPRFYAYLIRTLARIGYITSLARGIRERSTAFDQETFRALVLPCPPLRRQQAIAHYLDAETTRIDALIEKKQREASLVGERWQCVLSTTFQSDTKLRLKRLLNSPPAYGVLVPEHDPDGVPMLRITDLKTEGVDLDAVARIPASLSTEYRRTVVEVGDLMVSVVGTLGRSIEVDLKLAGCNLNRALARIQPQADVPRCLLRLWFGSPDFQRLARLATSSDSAQPTLGMEDLGNFPVGLPQDRMEWSFLSMRLEKGEHKVRTTLRLLDRQISLLTEHRQALIIAAVTGELEIPGVAA